MSRRRAKPRGWFTDSRGAERMRQSWARAVAAGASDSDLAVLGAVFVKTVGWSKLDDEITLAELATELGRWERPEPDDDRTDEQLERARARKTDRIGQSLRRLHDAGAVIYRPGRGGRRSSVALPEMDDYAEPVNPTGGRGVDDEPNPTPNVGLTDAQPHAARSSTPRGAVLNPTRRGPQPHAEQGGRPIGPIGPIGSDSARDARAARSATESPTADTEPDPDDVHAIADAIHDAVGRRHRGRANPADRAECEHVARALLTQPRAFRAEAGEIIATLEIDPTVELTRPAELHDRFRDLLVAHGFNPDEIPARLERSAARPAPRSATA